MMLKDSLFSKYEKPYVNKLVSAGTRLDKRLFDEYRKLDIKYGKEWGSCVVSLGETKAMATVTCDIQQPKATRPNEGLLFLNVEISSMAFPQSEQGSLQEMHTHLNRILEKCIKESRCVDLEALCIVAEEKVWNLRVDVVVLNYDGNIVGCSSIAALAALVHFRRPDVTIDGEEVFIHDAAEREPLPLSLHHYPVAISFAIYEDGNKILADPMEKEERGAQAELVLGMNAYRELCGMNLIGAALLNTDILIQCSKMAAETAAKLVQAIKTAVEEDSNQRAEKRMSCLVESIHLDRQLPGSQSRCLKYNLQELKETIQQIITETNDKEDTRNGDNETDSDVIVLSDDELQVVRKSGPSSAETFRKRKKDKNPWNYNSSNEEDDIVVVKKATGKSKSNKKTRKSKVVEKIQDDVPSSSDDDDIALVREITTEDRIIERIELSGESEEDDVMTLLPTDMEASSQSKGKNMIKHEAEN